MSVQINSDEQVTDRYLTGMLPHFLKPYWVRLVIVFLMLLAATALTLVLPLIVQKAVDGPITAGDANGLTPYGIAYFVAIILLAIVRLGQTYILQNVGQSALVAIRQTLFSHILRQDMRFFNNTPVGLIVS